MWPDIDQGSTVDKWANQGTVNSLMSIDTITGGYHSNAIGYWTCLMILDMKLLMNLMELNHYLVIISGEIIETM